MPRDRDQHVDKHGARRDTPRAGVKAIPSTTDGVPYMWINNPEASRPIDALTLSPEPPAGVPLEQHLSEQLEVVKGWSARVEARDKHNRAKFDDHVKAIEHYGGSAAKARVDCAALGERVATVETRCKEIQPSDEFQLETRASIVAIHGEKGDNGKLGELRKFVRQLSIIASIAIAGSFGAIYAVGFRRGDLDARVHALEDSRAQRIPVTDRKLESLQSQIVDLYSRLKEAPTP